MSKKLANDKCPSCGGTFVFNPKNQNLICKKCGSEVEIEFSKNVLKHDISEIRNSFKDFDRVEVHIVQSHKSADETIIHIASSNESCYILSNDRYADYPGYDAIENDRIFRFEITKNKILIYDLDLDITF